MAQDFLGAYHILVKLTLRALRNNLGNYSGFEVSCNEGTRQMFLLKSGESSGRLTELQATVATAKETRRTNAEALRSVFSRIRSSQPPTGLKLPRPLSLAPDSTAFSPQFPLVVLLAHYTS